MKAALAILAHVMEASMNFAKDGKASKEKEPTCQYERGATIPTVDFHMREKQTSGRLKLSHC